MRRRQVRRRRRRHSHRITRVKLPRYVQKARRGSKAYKSKRTFAVSRETHSPIDAVVQRGRRHESGLSITAK